MSPKVLVSATETKVVAYRMAGFAIVLHNSGGTVLEMEIPQHKSSWKFVPEKIKAKSMNVSFMTKEYCHRSLCLKVAKRVAEEIAFGVEGITDISAKEVEAAAKFARKMVFEFGMSDELGNRLIVPIDLSNPDLERVEFEIRIFMRRAFEKAHEIIENNKEMFEKLAQTLMERRKLGQNEIKAILEGRELPNEMAEDGTKNGKSKSTIFAKLKSLVSKL